MRLYEMSGQNQKAVQIVRQHRPQILPFKSLPPLAKKAVRSRAEELDADPPKPNTRFGYVELPIESLKEIIMDDLRAEDAPFKSFDEYHDWYVGHNDTPRHKQVWPITLNLLDDGMGVIDDGSHRLHSYIRSGIQTVPALFELHELGKDSIQVKKNQP